MAKLSYAEKKQRWEVRRVEIWALRAAGWTLTRIGRRLRISKQRVSQLLSKPYP